MNAFRMKEEKGNSQERTRIEQSRTSPFSTNPLNFPSFLWKLIKLKKSKAEKIICVYPLSNSPYDYAPLNRKS